MARRSFHPSDFRWRDTPWIAIGLIGFSLLIAGGAALLAGNPAWKWFLGTCPLFLAVFGAWSAYRGDVPRE